MKQRGLACLGLAVGMALSGARGDAAWLDDFGFRRLLTVTNLVAVGTDQADFPILVKLTEANFSFHNANADGHDVRFTAADGTTSLSFERERHGAGAAEYWVKLPALSSSAATSFYVYYRPADAADASDPTNVWDSNYCLVHHFEEASGSAYDSTVNAVTGTVTDVLATKLGSTGFVGNGVWYASTGNSFVQAANPMARPLTGTFEAWYKPDVLGGSLFRCTGTDGSAGYNVASLASGQLLTYIYSQAGNKYWCTGTTAVAVGEWNHVVDVYGASAPSPRKMYLNGELDATASEAVYPHHILFQGRNYLGYRAGGALDELRFSKTVRSAEWIRAQHASMRDQLLSYGTEEKGRVAFLADYPFRRLLTVTNLTAISSALADFPVRVSLTSANFSFDLSNPNGYDVRFTAADGITPLSYEREKHDPNAGTAEYWVKLPVLAAGSPTEFYIYHRRAAAADGADPTNVWDSNYCYVHHMEEASGSAKVYDSTANAVTGTVGATTLGTAGFIGNAAWYSTTAEINHDIPMAQSATATFEAWYKPDAASGWRYPLAWRYYDGSLWYYLAYGANSNLSAHIYSQAGLNFNCAGTNTLAPGNWHYITLVHGASTPSMRIYVNGILDGTNLTSAAPHSRSTDRQHLGYKAGGTLDELRYSKVARSESYLKAQDASMRNALLGYGMQETRYPGTVIMVR